MTLDLLILNPFDREYVQVPAGTFAIAAWLGDHGHQVRVVDLALGDRASLHARIDHALDRYRPRHVGLVLHWKETLLGFMAMGERVRRSGHRARVWAGGIQASCCAEDLLARASFLDGVILGDAERPLLQILQGQPPEVVDNLARCRAGEVVFPETRWTADSAFLDTLSYGGLGVLDDLDSYLRAIDELGLCLAPGRGCAHDCGPCGGSRSAHALHSSRCAPSMRSPGRVVDDVEEALGHGARTFLLSHTAGTCLPILRELRQRFGERPPFTLNLECWTLPGEELLREYASLCGPRPRRLHLSLRGSEHPEERVSERARTDDVIQRAEQLDPDLGIAVFSGWFAPWHTVEALDEELGATISHRRAGVRAEFFALATDPGSRWSTDPRLQVDSSLPSLARGIKRGRGSVRNNLLLHRPRALSPADEQRFLRIWHLDRALYKDLPRLWHVATALLDHPAWIELLSRAGRGLYHLVDDTLYPRPDFTRSAALLALEDECAAVGDRPHALLGALAGLLSHEQPVAPVEPHPYLVLGPGRALRSRWDLISLLQVPTTEERVLGILEDEGTWCFLRGRRIHRVHESRLRALARFDGLTVTQVVVERMAVDTAIPQEQLRSWVEELVGEGVLVPAL